MILDNYNFIIMEQNLTTDPGRLADSLAETSRYIVLAFVNGQKLDINLHYFVTDKGLLRHPLSPWGVEDTSLDQIYPLIAAAALISPNELRSKIDSFISGTKIYNGKIVTPGFKAQLNRSKDNSTPWIDDLALLGQALIFKLPFRWSDNKKWFEWSSGSSSDYLNYVNGLAFAKIKGETWPLKLARFIISKDKILGKIHEYYIPEPNVKWLLDEYEKALKVIYRV